MSTSRPLRGIPRTGGSRPRGPLLRWRREQLMDAGYDELTAHRLASDPGLDLHAILETTSPHARPSPSGGSAERQPAE